MIQNNNRPEEGIEEQINKEAIKYQLFIWCEGLIQSIIFLIAVILYLNTYISQLVPFALLAFIQVLRIIKQIVHLFKTQAKISRRFYFKELIQSFLSLLFFIYMLIIAYIPKAKFIISICPYIVNVLFFFLFKVEYMHKFQLFSSKIELSFKVIVTINLFFVGLKDINAIPMSWFYIFWSAWITVIILILIGISELVIGFRSYLRRNSNNQSPSETLSPFFLSYSTLGIAACTTYTFTILSLELDLASRPHLNISLITSITYLTSLLLITFISKTYLIEYLENYFYTSSFYFYRIPRHSSSNIDQIESNLIDLKIFPRKMHQISANFFEIAGEKEPFQSSKDTNDEGPKLCSICCLITPNAIFMNCGHGGVCFECACMLWFKNKKCFYCRSEVLMILKYESEHESVMKISRAVKLSQV